MDINLVGGDISMEDLIKDEEVIVIIIYLGYIKCMLSFEYCM